MMKSSAQFSSVWQDPSTRDALLGALRALRGGTWLGPWERLPTSVERLRVVPDADLPLPEFWIVRQCLPVVYAGWSHLIVATPTGLLLGMPPADDPTLPAFRCPPLDGSWSPPEPTRSSTEAADPVASGFEPLALGPIIHEALVRYRRAAVLDEGRASELLAHLFSLRWWMGHNSKDLCPPRTFSTYDAVPEDIRADLRTAGDESVSRAGPNESEVWCAPARVLDATRHCDAWLRGYQLQELAHDSQVGGGTRILWHTSVEVTSNRWTIERVMLWKRVVDGLEMS